MRYRPRLATTFRPALHLMPTVAHGAILAATRVVGCRVKRTAETTRNTPAPGSVVYSYDFETDAGDLRLLAALGFREGYWALSVNVIAVPPGGSTPPELVDQAQDIWNGWQPPDETKIVL